MAPETGEMIGALILRITARKQHFHWFEERDYFDGGSEVFSVTYDPATLLPSQYRRTLREKSGNTVIEIDARDEGLKVHITRPGGEVKTQELHYPSPPFVIEPFMKQYLSLHALEETACGTLNTLAYLNGAMRPVRLDWRAVARETISVEAGSFECIKVGLRPRSWCLRLLSGESFLWVDAVGDHKIVRTPVRRSVFSPENIMELARYGVSRCEESIDE
jgi:hypothetical protein